MVALPLLLLAGGVGAYYWTQIRPASSQSASGPETAKANTATEAASDEKKESSEGSTDADAGASNKAAGAKTWHRAPAQAAPDEDEAEEETGDPYEDIEAAAEEAAGDDTEKPAGQPAALAGAAVAPAAEGAPSPGTAPEIEPLPEPGAAPALPTPAKKKDKIDFSNPYK